MSLTANWGEVPLDAKASMPSNGANRVVLMVEDYQDARPELKQVLKLKGYHVIDADNGLDAARQARELHPDLLVVDMDVPLLYELMAARQIIKHAEVETMPVVIVTHEDVVDSAPMMELGVRPDEYVTRLSDYAELQYLLDYLLPVLPKDGRGNATSLSEAVGLPLQATSEQGLHLHPGDGPEHAEST